MSDDNWNKDITVLRSQVWYLKNTAFSISYQQQEWLAFLLDTEKEKNHWNQTKW